MNEKTKEHFCWVRAVAPLKAPAPAQIDDGGLDEAIGKPESTESPFTTEAVAERLRMSCPEVRWLAKPLKKFPPSPPVRLELADSLERTTRSVLGVQQMTTVHLEQPVARFDLDIDIRPIFGSRAEAWQWIESEEGRKYCNDASALSLICFAVVDGR